MVMPLRLVLPVCNSESCPMHGDGCGLHPSCSAGSEECSVTALLFGLKAQLTHGVRPRVNVPAVRWSPDTSILGALLQPQVTACPHPGSENHGQHCFILLSEH